MYEEYQIMRLGDEIPSHCYNCDGKGQLEYPEGVFHECPECEGRGFKLDPLTLCPHCERLVPNSEKIWTYDRYRIPFQKVCSDCFDEVDAQISEWEFDETYAGERLEEDY